jgi:hypothetical protein
VNLIVTSPSFSKARNLADALNARLPNRVSVVEWGQRPQREPSDDDRWIALVDNQADAGPNQRAVDLSTTLEEQLDLVLEDLRWLDT